MSLQPWRVPSALTRGLCMAVLAVPVGAHSLTFGLAGKSLDDANFVAAWKGCADEARKQGDICLHIGQTGAAQVRKQDSALLEALLRPQPLAGLAVSVTRSDNLVRSSLAKAASLQVPVITFDSDLESQHLKWRRSYVGPDSVAFGRQLGEAAAALHPQGGVVCLMSGSPSDTNLNLRMMGVRQALSGNALFGRGEKLKGERGWREPDRCPWYNGDDQERALKQMRMALTDLNVDAFISVGAWPQIDLDRYRAVVKPLKRDYLDMNKSVIVGIGQASNEQLALLKQGMVDAYVSIDFTEMGRMAYRTMKRIATGRPVEPVVYTPTVFYGSN